MAKKTATLKVKKVDMKLSISELMAELDKTRQDLAEAKRGHFQGELINPMVIKNYRRQVARLKTAIRYQQLAAQEEIK